MISNLLRRKANAEESEAKLKAFTSFVKVHKKQSQIGRHKQRWEAEDKRLKKQSKEAQNELADTHRLLRKKWGIEDEVIVDGFVEQQQAVHGSVFGLNAKLKSGKYPPVTLQDDFDTIKTYLIACGKEWLAEEIELETELAELRRRIQTKPNAQQFDYRDYMETLEREVKEGLKSDNKHVDLDLLGLLIRALSDTGDAYQTQIQGLVQEIKEEQMNYKWPENDHARYLKLVKEYNPGDNPSTRQEFHDRLKLELPHYSLQEVQEYHWTQERILYTRKKLATVREANQKSMQEFGENLRHGMTAAANLWEAQIQKDEEARARDLLRQDLQAKIAISKEARREKEAAELAKRLQEKEEEEEQERIAQERRNAYIQERLQQLETYRMQQAEERRRLAAIEAEENALKEAEELRQKKHNAERVAVRAEEYERRQQEFNAKMLELENEKRDRNERLQKLVDQVKIVAESNPERLKGHTESSKNRDDVDNPQIHAQFSHHGYKDDRIFKDNRFKLQNALANAGLLQTDYARQMMNAMPAYAPKVMQSQITF